MPQAVEFLQRVLNVEPNDGDAWGWRMRRRQAALAARTSSPVGPDRSSAKRAASCVRVELMRLSVRRSSDLC